MKKRSKNGHNETFLPSKAPPRENVEDLGDGQRWRITVSGVVQGIGFRPFVYRMAHKWGLQGWVKNTADGVILEVEGQPDVLRAFWEDFWKSLPAGAAFDNYHRSSVPALGQAEPAGFRIVSSDDGGERRPNIPPDLAVCRECLAELANPTDRRYRYPFINCTHCGPRWSIVEGVPYDRPLTSMKGFRLCPDCEREYRDPLDRRFHAQPIACPQCGPHLELWDRNGQVVAEKDEALRQAALAVLAGKILALKGLGGFQLICDATSGEAVRQLRIRKRRPDKPFALMMTEEMIRLSCVVPSQTVWDRLRSPASPIILLPRKDAENTQDHESCPWAISESVAPGNPYWGVMLPYTPLHHLLMETVNRPIVCTSGNISEEPMAIDNAEALHRLQGIADVFLVHNRPIVRPVDDSVMATDRSGNVVMVRRARGFAPRSLSLSGHQVPILATGGHLKNVVGLAIGNQAILSAHIGDLDNPLAFEAHRRAIEDLLRFFDTAPEVLSCDLHPDYGSTRSAEDLARRLKIPVFRWQHHVAHFAACLAEAESDEARRAVNELALSQETTTPGHPFGELPILGVIWDGTGYGTDGTSWGGEFFLFDGTSFCRVARLRTFPLPGGDIVVRQPRRSLLGLIYETGDRSLEQTLEKFFTPQELKILLRAMERNVQSPRTSSMGRLFDGIAAILGFGGHTSFEGQAAMALQYAAERGLLRAYPIISPRPFGGRGDGGEGGSNRCEFSQSIPTFLCPHPNPLPEGEGDFLRQALNSRRPPPKTAGKPSECDPEKQADVIATAREATDSTEVEPLLVHEVNGLLELNWQPLFQSVATAMSRGMSRELLALAFHVRLVDSVFQLYQMLRCRSLVISGGCFQNQLLRELIGAEAKRFGVPLYQPQLIPAGDGGIALGQLWLTARTLQGLVRADSLCEYIRP